MPGEELLSQPQADTAFRAIQEVYIECFPGRIQELKFTEKTLREIAAQIGPKGFRRACMRAREDDGEFVPLAKIHGQIQYPPDRDHDIYDGPKSWGRIVAEGMSELTPHLPVVALPAAAQPVVGWTNAIEEPTGGDEMAAHIAAAKKKHAPWLGGQTTETLAQKAGRMLKKINEIRAAGGDPRGDYPMPQASEPVVASQEATKTSE